MRQFFASLIRFSGLPFLIREIICRQRVTIIVYHNPQPKVFETHLRFIINHFQIISLEQLVGAIEGRSWQSIPPKSLVITFDDGHRGNFALLDIINRYKIPITVYVCAGIVNSQCHYWFLDFANQAQNLKRLPNQHRLNQLASYDYSLGKKYAERQALSKDEMLGMKRHQVDFQSHTLFHPILTACTDEESWVEISKARQVLEDLVEEPVQHFAYPNGDYGEREIILLQKAGYRSARTVDVGWNGPSTNPYELKGMTISDNATLDEMIAQLSGIFPFLRYLRQGSFTGIHPAIQIDNESS